MSGGEDRFWRPETTVDGCTLVRPGAAARADPFACRCRSFSSVPDGPTCTTRATQEDMLCDECRAGCGVAVGISKGKGRHLAVKAKSFGISLR